MPSNLKSQPTQPTCQQLTQDLEHIKELKKDLRKLLDQAKQLSPDLSDSSVRPILQQAWQIKTKLEQNTKELQDHLWPFEHLSLSSLKEQYESQKQVFTQIGILKKLEDGHLGIEGPDPDHPEQTREYPFPTLEVVKKRLRENKEKINYKTSQGFTRLQLTPFAMPIPALAEIVKTQILKHHEANQLFTAKKDPADPTEKLIPLELNETQPMWVWGADDKSNYYDPNALVYYPDQFIKTEDETETQKHGGQTKSNIIKQQTQTNDPFLGWEAKLFEDNPNIPAKEAIGDRPQLDTGQKPKEYLSTIQDEAKHPYYRHEDGLTPEDWLTFFVTHLETTNQVIDDYQGNGKTCYLLATWFPDSGYVGNANWNLYFRQALLDRINPENQNDCYGSRSAVRVLKS